MLRASLAFLLLASVLAAPHHKLQTRTAPKHEKHPLGHRASSPTRDLEEDTTCVNGAGVCEGWDVKYEFLGYRAFCKERGYTQASLKGYATCGTRSACCSTTCAEGAGICATACGLPLGDEIAEDSSCNYGKCCAREPPKTPQIVETEFVDRVVCDDAVEEALAECHTVPMVLPPPLLIAPKKYVRCPVDYGKILKMGQTLGPVFSRDLEEGEADSLRLETVTVCDEVAQDGSCETTLDLQVSSGTCASKLKHLSNSLADSGISFTSPMWSDDIIQTVVGSRTAFSCWKAEQIYTGNGAAHLGFALFNCLLRNSFHLRDKIPQGVYKYAYTLNQELMIQTEARKESLPALYRGTRCLNDLNVDDILISLSFLSTSPELPASYITEKRCIFIFTDVVGAVPVSQYEASEQEVLLQSGQCFRVTENNRDENNRLFPDNPHKGETFLSSTPCPEEGLDQLVAL
eukprot:c8955_g1_i2.p1 GENE.c8955_g1_i2~~c8955_g1_i2.p1  ORF type:complete len:467 (+),score=66.02 c8955_g1_i2:22-1401(+)